MIQNKEEEAFLLHLFTYHPHAVQKGISKPTEYMAIKIGQSVKNTPCYFICHQNQNNGLKKKNCELDISYVKCIGALAHDYTRQVKDTELNVDSYISMFVQMMKQYPFIRSKLMQLLLQKLPHPAHPILAHSIYLQILVKLMKTFEPVEDQVLETLIERMSHIDAEVSIPKHRHGVTMKNYIQKLETKGYHKQDEKLDLYLSTLLEYLDQRMTSLQKSAIYSRIPVMEESKEQESLSAEDELLKTSDDEDEPARMRILNAQEKLDHLVDTLISIFEYKVFDLTESKFSQYLFLYLCKLNEQFHQKFVTLLMIKAFSTKLHVSMRMHYANYLSSFIARADCSKGKGSEKMLSKTLHFYIKFIKEKYFNHKKL